MTLDDLMIARGGLSHKAIRPHGAANEAIIDGTVSLTRLLDMRR